MEKPPVHSVGLGGDGDEVAAIQDVEQEFGLSLDYSDAPHWFTAGDVFASLLKALPGDGAEDPQVWNRFTKALTGQTGTDPALVSKDSPLLLSQSVVWARIETAWGYLFWGILALALVVVASDFFANR